MSSQIARHVRQLDLRAASTAVGYVDGAGILAFAAGIPQQEL